MKGVWIWENGLFSGSLGLFLEEFRFVDEYQVRKIECIP